MTPSRPLHILPLKPYTRPKSPETHEIAHREAPRMSTIYFDTHLGDEERRRRLYAGDVFVYSPRPSTRALTELARELIEEAFRPSIPSMRRTTCRSRSSSRSWVP